MARRVLIGAVIALAVVAGWGLPTGRRLVEPAGSPWYISNPDHATVLIGNVRAVEFTDAQRWAATIVHRGLVLDDGDYHDPETWDVVEDYDVVKVPDWGIGHNSDGEFRVFQAGELSMRDYHRPVARQGWQYVMPEGTRPFVVLEWQGASGLDLVFHWGGPDAEDQGWYARSEVGLP